MEVKINLLDIILDGKCGINSVTRDILLKLDRESIKNISNILVDYKYMDKTNSGIDSIIYRLNSDLNNINFRYDEYLGINKEFVKENLEDVLTLVQLQSKYLVGDFKFNSDVFNIILLRYTMEQGKYRVDKDSISELFKIIGERLDKIIREYGEYGAEKIRDYRNKNSDFYIELINIFRMAGNYHKLFGFIKKTESKEEFIQFKDSRNIYYSEFDLKKTLERWFEYNEKLSRCIREDRSISGIIQISLLYDEDYILFGREKFDKKEINNWIKNKLDIAEQGRLFKLIKRTITWSNRHDINDSKYFVVNYVILNELLHSGNLGKLKYEDLVDRYGKIILIERNLDMGVLGVKTVESSGVGTIEDN